MPEKTDQPVQNDTLFAKLDTICIILPHMSCLDFFVYHFDTPELFLQVLDTKRFTTIS